METDAIKYFSAYPDFLTAADIMDMLQVSNGTAYNMMKDAKSSTGTIITYGKSVRAVRDPFVMWLLSQSKSGSERNERAAEA